MPPKQKKTHREPTETTKKQILSASGNQCAFTACSAIIVDRDHGVLVGKIAHIKGRKEGSARFDKNQTEDENRSATNLLGLCGQHHDIVDAREDIYTVEKMVAMKTEHEEKVENSADRSWIRFPNTSIQQIAGFKTTQFHFWIDRNGRPRIYSDRQLAIARTALDLYQDIDRLCQLYKMVEENPEAPGKALLQTYVKLRKENARLETGTPWSPIAQILCQMAEMPEITLGEFVTYLVQEGDATQLFVSRAEVLKGKIDDIQAGKGAI